MAKSRQEKWIMVRLRRSTHRKLLDLERLWVEAYARGEQVPAPDDRDGIGIDRMVAELLKRDNAHRARARFGRSAKPTEVAETPTRKRDTVTLDDTSPAEGVQFGPGRPPAPDE
jgi:hypothetical protein